MCAVCLYACNWVFSFIHSISFVKTGNQFKNMFVFFFEELKKICTIMLRERREWERRRERKAKFVSKNHLEWLNEWNPNSGSSTSSIFCEPRRWFNEYWISELKQSERAIVATAVNWNWKSKVSNKDENKMKWRMMKPFFVLRFNVYWP